MQISTNRGFTFNISDNVRDGILLFGRAVAENSEVPVLYSARDETNTKIVINVGGEIVQTAKDLDWFNLEHMKVYVSLADDVAERLRGNRLVGLGKKTAIEIHVAPPRTG